jgi:hypothetical protein
MGAAGERGGQSKVGLLSSGGEFSHDDCPALPEAATTLRQRDALARPNLGAEVLALLFEPGAEARRGRKAVGPAHRVIALLDAAVLLPLRRTRRLPRRQPRQPPEQECGQTGSVARANSVNSSALIPCLPLAYVAHTTWLMEGSAP